MSNKQKREALNQKRKDKAYRDWLDSSEKTGEEKTGAVSAALIQQKRAEALLAKGKKGSQRLR